MENINRRVALAAGLTVVGMPLLAGSAAAVPKTYGADEGKEVAPGVRLIELGKRNSNIGTYKTVEMIDVVYQPGVERAAWGSYGSRHGMPGDRRRT